MTAGVDPLRLSSICVRDEEMIPLAEAAVCRSESDWLVGINGTRAMTAFNNKTGGFQLTPVGRVQTPTLAILAEREEKIHQFKPRTYFEVLADFEVKAGNYRGRWFREDFSKEGEEDARAERIWEQAVGRCNQRSLPWERPGLPPKSASRPRRRRRCFTI